MSRTDKSQPQAVSAGQAVFVFINQASSTAVMNLEITGQFVSAIYAALADESFREAYASGTADFLPFTPNPNLSTGFIRPSPLARFRTTTSSTTPSFSAAQPSRTPPRV
jgi:hypothetical protein